MCVLIAHSLSSFDRKFLQHETFAFFLKIDIERSINVSIFDKFSNMGVLHISVDQFWALKPNRALFLSKIDFRSISVWIFDRSVWIFDEYESCCISFWSFALFPLLFRKSISIDRYTGCPIENANYETPTISSF